MALKELVRELRPHATFEVLKLSAEAIWGWAVGGGVFLGAIAGLVGVIRSHVDLVSIAAVAVLGGLLMYLGASAFAKRIASHLPEALSAAMSVAVKKERETSVEVIVNDPSKLMIHSAFYGAPDKGGTDHDVAPALRVLAGSGSLVLEIENHHFVVDGHNYVPKDPKSGDIKRLEVVYSYGNRNLITIQRPEHTRLVLPEDTWCKEEIERLRHQAISNQTSQEEAASPRSLTPVAPGSAPLFTHEIDFQRSALITIALCIFRNASGRVLGPVTSELVYTNEQGFKVAELKQKAEWNGTAHPKDPFANFGPGETNALWIATRTGDYPEITLTWLDPSNTTSGFGHKLLGVGTYNVNVKLLTPLGEWTCELLLINSKEGELELLKKA